MMMSLFKLMNAAIPMIVCGLLADPAMADTFAGKKVEYLSAGDSRPCIFFTLVGITQAVASLPNVAWFTLPKSHPNYRETFAILMAGKLTNRPLSINTTGATSNCGHAEVQSVSFMPD